MKPGKNCVLTINGGSSSIKFALYEYSEPQNLLLSGQIKNIGTKNILFYFLKGDSCEKIEIEIQAKGFDIAINQLIDWLEKQIDFDAVKGIGHRVVHGMEHTKPQIITEELLVDLKEISDYDPDHLPEEIKVIAIFKRRYPNLVQIACFDTSFHTTMPAVAKLLTIPRRYNRMGIHRFGFHGISYAYLTEQLKQVEGNPMFRERVVLAHLGNGASLAAVRDGKSIDTSMGFSPSSGIPMGTRTGDIDPGIAWYLMKAEKLSLIQFNDLVNHQSGLLGISETNSDMQELLKIQETDCRAKEAIELFCYQARKWVGSFAAALHGIDTLVFSGGIGENSPEVRERICGGLQFLGIELDKERNFKSEPVISADTSSVCVRVIKTNEELMIAKSVCDILNNNIKN